MKIERLLAITIILLNRRQVLAKDLAERFEVSVRTIYRDIQTLNGAGIPVVSYQGYGGGLCIPDNYKVSRQLLTFNDMVSILTTLKGVNYTLKNKDVERAIEKISSLIPEEREGEYLRHTDSFVVDISSWWTGERLRNIIKQIHESVSVSSLLHFAYTGANGKRSSRKVEPHTLIYKNFTWYLLAYCLKRNGFRLFRMSRIRDLICLAEHFVRRSVAPLTYFQENEGRKMVELILKFNPSIRVKVEEQFEDSQLTEDADGFLVATFSLPDDDWVLSYILSLGSDVEVIHPLSLRAAVQKKCAEIQKKYTNMT